MNKICTSIERSQKLIELGIDVNTADMCYYYDHNWSNEHIEIPKIWDNNYEQFIPESEEDDIPAWSITALSNIIKDNCERCEIHLRNDKKYNIFVTSGTFIYRSFDIYPNGFDELVDAYYEVVCWLKKEKYI